MSKVIQKVLSAFKVKSNIHKWSGEFKVQRPASLDPKEWNHLVGGDQVDAIIDLALAQWKIKAADGMRDQKTVAAARHWMERYRVGGARVRPARIIDAATYPGGMTPEVAEWFRANGDTVINMK